MIDTILKQEDAVKCDNKETEVLENKQQESKSVSVTVTGFSLFADTLKQRNNKRNLLWQVPIHP